MKKIISFLTNRITISAICMAVQIVVWVVMVAFFNEYFALFYTVNICLTICVVVFIINKNTNPAYKLAWLIPILLFPIFGGIFYITFAGNRLTKRQEQNMRSINNSYFKNLSNSPSCTKEIFEQNADAGIMAKYLERITGVHSFSNTSSDFLEIGEVFFENMLKEMKKAEKFIFLEFFIVKQGYMWDSIVEVLKQKVKQGVEVRFIYDDFGSLFTLPSDYIKQMQSLGIKCCAFNRLTPKLTFKYNNRDHRKICVIDGNIGFTGGINLSDEYINKIEVFGHWKDCGIVLKGEAVWSLTVMFLTMWDFIIDEVSSDFSNYKPDLEFIKTIKSDGYIMPYTDTPLDNESVGENVYLQLINRAKKYVYINTPYLIIDNEITTALCIAAKSGIDVRICTPHIADKLFIHAMTRSNYEILIESGVKIYEYTPGFLHSKTFVVDDIYAVVGTINMDFRSLYLHYECAVWLYNASCIKNIKNDYIKTLNVCTPITLSYCKSQSKIKKVICSLLKIFSPLM